MQQKLLGESQNRQNLRCYTKKENCLPFTARKKFFFFLKKTHMQCFCLYFSVSYKCYNDTRVALPAITIRYVWPPFCATACNLFQNLRQDLNCRYFTTRLCNLLLSFSLSNTKCGFFIVGTLSIFSCLNLGLKCFVSD